MHDLNLTVIILTQNEARHLERCLTSVKDFASHVLVVDSGSTDDTVEIAERLGAKVIHNPWLNYATQFNFALDQLPEDADWVFRLDADEVVTPQLSAEITKKIGGIGPEVSGVLLSRRMSFLNKRIRWGGIFPIRIVRIFRAGRGRCEARWMDEHIIVDGETVEFAGEIYDDNMNSLTWWTDKHNAYASREAVDLLNLEYGFRPHETVTNLRSGRQARIKRWLKEAVYSHLPGGLRAFVYFLYRYVLRLGFLDGREGAAFHVLQGFWYRYLVDAKLHEVRLYMRRNNVDVVTAVRHVLGIDPLR